MTLADQSRYNRLVWKVIQKVGESEINYIKIFQYDKALAISVGNIYSEDQLMHTFLEHFQQGKKNCSYRNLPSRIKEIRKHFYQKLLSISALQIDHLGLSK